MDQLIEGNLNLMNGIACIFWSGFLLASIYQQKIRYSAHGRVVRRDSPKLYWILIAAIGAIAVWTGVTFVLHRA